MGKRAVSLLGFKLVMVLVLLIWGFISLFESNAVDDAAKQAILVGFQDNKAASILFVKTLDELTPTLHVPGTVPHIFGVTDFPLLGLFSTLIIVLLIFVVSFFLDKSKLNVIGRILVYLLLIPIGYYIGIWIAFIAFHLAASSLGLSAPQAEQVRLTYSNSFRGVLLPLIIVGAFSALTIFKTIKGRAK